VGAYEVFRNLAIFMVVLNLGAIMAGVLFPSMRIAVMDSVGLVEEMKSQAESINPENTGTIGDLATTFGFIKFFFGNLVLGNYYVWKMIGLANPIVLEPGAEASSTWTFAYVLSIFTEFIYAIALIEFARGKV